MIRVTQVLDYFTPPELVDWKVDNGRKKANKIMRDAAKFGTRIDELIKTGNEPTKKDKPEVKSCYKAFLKWKLIYDPKEIVVCTRLHGKINGIEISGEPDLLVDAVLHDVKGTKAVRKKNWIQLNVYEELRRQNGLKESPKLRILRIDQTTESYEYPNAQPFDKSLVSVFGGLLSGYLYYKGDNDGGLDVQEVGENKEVA